MVGKKLNEDEVADSRRLKVLCSACCARTAVPPLVAAPAAVAQGTVQSQRQGKCLTLAACTVDGLTRALERPELNSRLAHAAVPRDASALNCSECSSMPSSCSYMQLPK